MDETDLHRGNIEKVLVQSLYEDYTKLYHKKEIAKIVGVIFAIVGLISLIYLQLTQNSFNLFDCIAMVLGRMLAYSSK